VAVGFRTSYFGHDEFAAYAPGMKTIEEAATVGCRIFGAFEIAETCADPDERRDWLTFAIVGAGPTGVELAGQVRPAATHTLKREFRTIHPSSARVLLFDGGKEPLATFGDHLSERATRELEKLGVELHMGSLATSIDDHGLEVRSTDGKVTRYEARTVVWTTGVLASPLGRMLAAASGASTDRAGRVEVPPDCTLPRRPEVFAVGDMMSLNHLPGVAEVAMQSGMHAAHDPPAARRSCDEALPLRGPGQHCLRGRLARGGRLPRTEAERLPGWADVTRGSHYVPDRLHEPVHGGPQLGDGPDRDAEGSHLQRVGRRSHGECGHRAHGSGHRSTMSRPARVFEDPGHSP